MTQLPQSLVDQIDMKIAHIRNLALQKARTALECGAFPPHWETSPNDHRLSKAIIDSVCTDRPYQPLDKQTKKDFKNLSLFL